MYSNSDQNNLKILLLKLVSEAELKPTTITESCNLVRVKIKALLHKCFYSEATPKLYYLGEGEGQQFFYMWGQEL